MKSKMKVCLIIFALIISLIIPSIVNATSVTPAEPTVSISKDSSVKEGDVVTVTVTYPNTSGIYFNIEFDPETFEINTDSAKAYNSDNQDVRILGNSTIAKVDDSLNGKYKVTAGISSNDNINRVEVQLTAKKDIKEGTTITVSNIANNGFVFNNNSGKAGQTLSIAPIPAPVVTPSTEQATQPAGNPAPVADPAPASTAPAATPVKDTTPKTGSVDVSLNVMLASIISLAGIVVVMKYSK